MVKAPTPTEEEISKKAHELWRARNKSAGTAEDDWYEAIKALEKERSPRGRILRPLSPFWRWTGFGDKKLWDFLQLLLVPLLLAVAGYLLQEYGKQREKVAADEKAHQDTLTKYLNNMEKGLDAGLLTQKPGDKTFIIAQARTVTALQSLDPVRQHLVLQFLKSANLDSLANHGLLYKAQMSKANLSKGDLSGIKLKGADLSIANLSGADLSSADLSGANLGVANLSGADLFGANLNSAHLMLADLIGANLIRANLSGADLSSADLQHALYDKGTKLPQGFDVKRKQMYFVGPGSNLSNADLSGNELSWANLSGTNLRGAYLVWANLSWANLNEANLSGANLRRTDLGAANLSGADLSGADLYQADLRKTQGLTVEQVKSAMAWEQATYDAEFRRQLGLLPK